MVDVPVSFTIFGASGDLAKKKIFPALFALYARKFLSPECTFTGFARSELDDVSFREKIAHSLKCEEIGSGACSLAMGQFLKRCHYVRGGYDSPQDLAALGGKLRAIEPSPPSRIFYMALPPSVFLGACESIGAAGLKGHDDGEQGWTRIVMEKPFGRDRASSDRLVRKTRAIFDEHQIYRIDHYLGKEVVQNLMALRFANSFLEPVWNSQYIEHVHILWKEDLDLGGRAGYFDSYGIIRDIMQNHLTQILALIAMEEPLDCSANAIRDAKTALLRGVAPLLPENLVVGQYTRGKAKDGTEKPGYLEEPGVPPDSTTCTYAAAVLKADYGRWRGVPFLMSAGKGLDARETEIRVHFKKRAGTLYKNIPREPNALIIRVQPDEAIKLCITNKVPGFTPELDTAALDLSYAKTFSGRIADAYENLLLDVTRGERGLFIREDELAAAWDIFDPVLHDLDTRRITPEPYAFGMPGPEGMRLLAARHGFDDCND